MTYWTGTSEGIFEGISQRLVQSAEMPLARHYRAVRVFRRKRLRDM
jgi:hypothetical protein